MLSTENPPPDLSCPSSSDDNNINNNQVVDLFKPVLDDDDDNNSLPKFSIRDYVFNTRDKNIKTHWPFSAKNLKLLLKHGVKDVLPPFDTLDSVKSPTTVKFAVENTSNSDEKLRLSNNNGQKLALDIEYTKSSGPEEEDKEYSPYLEPEAENLPEFVAPASKKVESNIQNPIKKCKLILKSSNVVEPKSKEDLSLNTSMVSEITMASKVCPVCKTFSSSSNTTLNAHIDQCLSGESTVKPTTDSSKVVKHHRIKPRKTRMMVDIYTTALHSTLEDLDKRNGTNWASNLGFPARDLEACAEEKDEAFSCEDKNEESAVYVDSNGTKVRILSKFSDLPSTSNCKDDCGPSKIVERDKTSELISSKKKKKYLVQKHKLLNPRYGQMSCSPRPDNCPEVNNGEQRKSTPEKDYEMEDLREPVKARDKMKPHDFGMIKQWVSSKRTGLRKKINPEHKSQHPCKVIKKSRLNSDEFVKTSRNSSFPVSSDENPLLSTESHERKENLSCDDSHGEYTEHPRLRKRAGFSLSESRDFPGSKKNHVVNVKQFKKVGPSVHDRHTHHPNEFTSPKKTSLDRTILSGAKRFSSLSKNLSSVGHESVSETKKNLGKKLPEFKKRKLRYISGSDEEEAVEPNENASRMETVFDKSSNDQYRVLKIRKKQRGFVNTGEEGENLDGKKESEKIQEDFVCEPTSKPAHDEAFIAASDKSLDSGFPGLAKSSDLECISRNYIKPYEENCPVLGGEREMLCTTNRIGEDFITCDSPRVVADNIDANEGQENGNYFVDVDPIPIPGPPGSFLPSPGRMGSEELQGNSSLTTCRVHSSEDERELVDMDSSDSPISTMSNLSNSKGTEKLDGMRANSVLLPEMSPPRFKNSQPCCCSRKDGVLQNGPLNYQDSQLLRRRTMNITLPQIPAQEKEIDRGLEKKVYGFNFGSSDRLPDKEAALSGSEKAVDNTQIRYNSEAKFPYFGDCESPSPSTPVLRLMGKNLMVANKDEYPSPQTRLNQSNVVVDHPRLMQSYVDHNSVPTFHHTLSRGGPAVFHNVIPGQVQHLGFGSGRDNNFTTQDFSRSESFGRSFGSSLDYHEYAGGPHLNNRDQFGSKIRLDATPVFAYDAEKSARAPMKEIIVIDDSPEYESGSGSQMVSGGYDPRHVNSIYGYQTRYYPIYHGSEMGRNSNIIQVGQPPSKGMINANSLPAASTGDHPRSSFYFTSPGFP